MANMQKMIDKERQAKFLKDGLFCEYKVAFELPSYKAWDAMLGLRTEGQITYRAATDESVLSGEFEAGFGWWAADEGEEPEGIAPFATFTEACQSFEKHLFGKRLKDAEVKL